MKKLVLISFFLIGFISFAQEKNYVNFFEQCKNEVSKRTCGMILIEKEIQELYKTYRKTALNTYDKESITLKYTILKNGSIKLENITGNIEHFKPIIKKLFTKLPKIEPVVENGKKRDALFTSIFYLFPKTK